MKEELLRKIPSVDAVLRKLSKDFEEVPRGVLVDAVRETVDRYREEILKGRIKDFSPSSIESAVRERISALLSPRLKRVINATGVVLHTNLGRAPISEEVLERVREVITRYSNLEYDLERGKRGLRYRNLEWILRKLTGAEDVCVVNNNAGAVLLVLSALARGREVIVSRGELIEIGGSFRMPDVMAQSGAILREVGTTNKTRLSDYESAISENTALLMKVHTSNYRILGFTESVSGRELSELGKKYGIPVYEDLGSGCFVNTEILGLSHEPTVQEVLKSGVDIVSFSGDKLLGGAQAGIILGKKNLVEKVKTHPLNRALRVDKFTLAVLEATLLFYLDEKKALEKIPVWKLLSQEIGRIKERGERLLSFLNEKGVGERAEVGIVREESEVGGGALPLQTLPTYCVFVVPKDLEISEFEKRMRSYRIPVIGRVKEDAYLLDMRTVFDDEIGILADAVTYCLG